MVAVAILVRSTFYASFFILPYRCQGLWYGMHYGYDDLQYGKDRVGVLYTKFWTSLLYFRKDFALPWYKIQATIYGGDIHIFRDTLIIGKNYYISNAWVKEIGAQYQIVQNNLQWTINGRTIVEEVTGDSEIIVPAVYSFVPFSRLHTYIDSLSHIDVIGIAIEIKPKKEIITNNGLEIVQEMTLMNDNMDTVMLTMWNQFVNNECTQILNIMNRKPIIIGCRLKVSSYNGMYLAFNQILQFICIEPEIPQAAALSIWYNANAEKAMDIICGRIGLETKSLSTLPSAEDIITIKMIDNQLNTRFNCLYCRHDQVKAMPRCRVIVDLIDEVFIIECYIVQEIKLKISWLHCI
ncbi:hypothetical protein FEM48_ZijujUnG0111900 [Ziziphus jujuba var. spinosa]|uniref:Replication protein A OB domain-containing protein n=1 Tax=Ziziphus jujuba var. spinosa TaxID=714518 RepID=A0A978U7Z9_ZIZJJ|nr:hypothetical protein FEM48_ZijujUnG0111900 [Ziziphus jujuba var. spinosa]